MHQLALQTRLPDIAPLEVLSLEVWAELRERLRLAGFITHYAANIRRAAIGTYAEGLQRPILLWHLRHRPVPYAYALRMFSLGDAITLEEASQAIGRPLIDKLLDAGLLIQPEADTVVSAFDCRVFRGLLILCDDLAYRGDAVYGVGHGTTAFCDLSSRHCRVQSALDVACGAGAVALWHCARAERVVATDINPRGLAFVKINASLNGISNIEVREGDLFEPVQGERFDIITSQPPYVPEAPGLRPAIYLFGGPNGNELVTRLWSELSSHLTCHGRGMVVFEHPARGDGDGFESVKPAFDSDTHALFIVGEEVDADAYSLRHAAPELRRSTDAFDNSATDMRDHLQKVGIRGLCPAVGVMERCENSRGWTAILRAGDNLWNEVSTETIERLLASQVLLRQPANGHLRARVRIPEGSVVVRPVARENGTANNIYLGLPPGYLLSSLELSQQEWAVLEAFEGAESVTPLPTELIAKAAQAGLIE